MLYSKEIQLRKKIKESTVWSNFSKFIRLRDRIDVTEYCSCCSCGKIIHWKYEAEAGHYISRRYKAFKYDEKNVHAQCTHCNKYLNGNMIKYRKFLVKKYGEQVVLNMEDMMHKPCKLDQQYLNYINNKSLEYIKRCL